jgi:ribulose 1,5-bisphosphate carboxylase large subunit-like protein
VGARIARCGLTALVEHIELTILAEHADELSLRKFVDDLQRLSDLPSTRIDVAHRSSTALELKIRYPLAIFDHSVGQFLAILFGEIPFMRAFGQARFEDLSLPPQVYDWFRGPAFGAYSVFERFGISESPFLLAILKPSLDLDATAEEFQRRLEQPLAGGFHAAKDDETQGDFPNLRLETRLDMASRNRRYIPAVNLDNPAALRDVFGRSELGMVMVNATILGFPMLQELRKSTKIPILSHLSMQGVYSTCFSHRIYALLHRLFGSDAFITPMGDTHYYRASRAEESEMVGAFTSELPIAKTLPLLTGGGRLDNLRAIMAPYQAAKVPYGIVLGGLIFNSERPPREMASAVVQTVAEAKRVLALPAEPAPRSLDC